MSPGILCDLPSKGPGVSSDPVYYLPSARPKTWTGRLATSTWLRAARSGLSSVVTRTVICCSRPLPVLMGFTGSPGDLSGPHHSVKWQG